MVKFEEKFIVINRKRCEELNKVYLDSFLGDDAKKHIDDHPVVARLSNALIAFDTAYRKEFGPSKERRYIVCNQDELYAPEVLKIILLGEERKMINLDYNGVLSDGFGPQPGGCMKDLLDNLTKPVEEPVGAKYELHTKKEVIEIIKSFIKLYELAVDKSVIDELIIALCCPPVLLDLDTSIKEGVLDVLKNATKEEEKSRCENEES